MGSFITAIGFTTDLGSLENLTIEYFLYSYDSENSETIILEANNSTNIFDKMDGPFLNLIQAEGVGV